MKGNGQGMIVIQADEHVPQDVVTGLNARGIKAYSAYHEDLSGASDRKVFEYAQRRNRTILTNDPDFSLSSKRVSTTAFSI